MFNAAGDAPKCKELRAGYRTCGEKPWFSVTTAPKGTYRESDIVDVLQRQLKILKKANQRPLVDSRAGRFIGPPFFLVQCPAQRHNMAGPYLFSEEAPPPPQL